MSASTRMSAFGCARAGALPAAVFAAGASAVPSGQNGERRAGRARRDVGGGAWRSRLGGNQPENPVRALETARDQGRASATMGAWQTPAHRNASPLGSPRSRNRRPWRSTPRPRRSRPPARTSSASGRASPISRRRRRSSRPRWPRARDPRFHHYSPTPGPARAPRGDRAQDQARLRRRLRCGAGGRHQRREARRLQHVPGAVRPGRRGARCPRRTGRRIPSASRSAAAFPVVLPTTEATASASPSSSSTRRSRRARRRCCSCRRATRPARCTRPTRSRRSVAGRSSAASGSSPTRSTSTSRTTATCSRRCPALVPELMDQCVILNGVAKTYAMTGWRVGWMIGPHDVIAAATNLQSHSTSNVSNVAQAAALAAVTGDLAAVAEMRDAFARRGRMMYELLSKIPGVTRARAAGRVLLLPLVRRRARARDRRPHAPHDARAVRGAARRGEGRDRARRGVRRARLRPAVASRSATTTSARECAASPKSGV